MSKVIKEIETTVISTRSVEVIAAEINNLKDQTQRMFIYNSIEMGRKLTEAKQYVPHGEWGKWLEESVDFKQSTANNLMRVFEEYGSEQLAMLGDNTKSHAFGKLSYSQAVALLAVPAEEREEFIEENKVEDLSTRELTKAIKDNQDLKKKLAESEEREKAAKAAREIVSKQNDEIHKQIRANDAKLQQLQADLEEANKSGDAKGAAKLKTELRKAEKATAESLETIAKLKAEMEEKLKASETELESKVEEKVKQREQELEAQAKQLETDLAEKLRKATEENEKQLAGMKEQLSKNNNVAAIMVKNRFETLVENFKGYLAAVDAVENAEEKKSFQDKLVKLCDMMKGTVIEKDAP